MIQAKDRGLGIPKMLQATGNNKPPELVFQVNFTPTPIIT